MSVQATEANGSVQVTEPGGSASTGGPGLTTPAALVGVPGIQGPPGEPGPLNLFIQGEQPVTSLARYVWVDTSEEPPVLYVEDGEQPIP